MRVEKDLLQNSEQLLMFNTLLKDSVDGQLWNRNESISYHLLNSYYLLETIYHAKHKLSHLTFIMKNWCSWTVVLEKSLKSPWMARRSNQSVRKEINPEYSLEGLMLKLKLQHFGHLMQRANSWEKTLILGKTEGRRRRGLQRMRWLDGITDSMDMSLSKLWREWRTIAWHAAVYGATKSQTWQWMNNNNKPLRWVLPSCPFNRGGSSV